MDNFKNTKAYIMQTTFRKRHFKNVIWNAISCT